MKTYQLFILCIVVCGCNFTYENNTNHDASLEQLKKETDSLKKEINALKKGLMQKDTVSHQAEVVQMNYPSVTTDTNSNRSVPEKKRTPTRKVTPLQTAVSKDTDTIIHFYKNTKKVSVKIIPRNTQQKSIIYFYDLKGNKTFEQEDIHASYSISTDIKEWHANGAVKRIVIHFNPGASIHWYETIISFDTDNTPLWKEEITYPITLDNMMNNKFYWDKSKAQWITQETVVEQPYVK